MDDLTDEKLGKLDGKKDGKLPPDQQQLLENKIEDQNPGKLTSKMEKNVDGNHQNVSLGTSWQALHNGQIVDVLRNPSLYRLFDAVTLCNNATLGENGNALGLPTEAALLLASHRLGMIMVIVITYNPSKYTL